MGALRPLLDRCFIGGFRVVVVGCGICASRVSAATATPSVIIVRCFGNWMGHPQREGKQRPIQLVDVLAVLSALQRVLEDYPWTI